MLTKFYEDLIIPETVVQLGKANQVYVIVKQVSDFNGIEIFSDTNDIYFIGGVDPAIDKTRASDGDVKLKNYFFFDFDIRKEYPDMTDEAIKELGRGWMQACLEGSDLTKNWRYIVFTGNGLHVYFFSPEPVAITDPEAWRMGLTKFLDSAEVSMGYKPDRACVNVSRISRLPGTFNQKSDPAKHVEIIAFQDVYTGAIERMEERGREAIQEIVKEQEARSKELATRFPTEDQTFHQINELPIAEVVAKVMGWNIVPDKNGKTYFIRPGAPRRSACFVPAGANHLIHGGTNEFPDFGKKGFNCFDFVQSVKSLSSRDTFFWFKDNFKQIMGDEIKKEIKRVGIGKVFDKLQKFTFTPLPLKQDLDRYKFIIKGAVTRLGAMSYTGKSKMLYYLTHLLINNGKRGFFISTEVPAEMVLANMLMIRMPEARSIWDILDNPDSIPSSIQEDFANLEIFDVKDTHNTLQAVEELVQKYQAEQNSKLDFICIDFCQMMTPKARVNSEFHQMTKYAQEVQEMAQTYEIAVLDASQLNDQGIKDENEKYGDIPFRNSKDLYNNADIAVMLKRDRTGDSDNAMKFSIRKHKYMKPITLDMDYDYHNGSFSLHTKHALDVTAERYS